MTKQTRLPQLRTTGKWITDPGGNVVILRGVNLVSKTRNTPEQLGFDARNAEFLAKGTCRNNCYNFFGRGWTV
jgi:hypothetical protein